MAAPLAKFVPLATLSAVLVNVAFHMGEWHNFRRFSQWPVCDTAVFLSAFALTVVIDLTVAVEIGMVLAAILFIKRSSETTQIMAVDETTETEGSHHSLVGKEVPKGVMVYRMMGAFFFGAVDKLESVLQRLSQEPEVLILRMRKVVAMDATGLNALEDLHEKLRKRGKHLVLSAPHTNPMMVMERAGFIDRLGPENVCPHIDAALDGPANILGLPPAKRFDPNLEEKKKLEAVPAGIVRRLGPRQRSSKNPRPDRSGPRVYTKTRSPSGPSKLNPAPLAQRAGSRPLRPTDPNSSCSEETFFEIDRARPT